MDYDRVSEKDWEELIQKSDNTYFFCSPLWAKIIEKSFDDYRTATRLYHINDKTILVPMMEKNPHGFKYFESMPGGYGGFFSESDITTDDFKSIVNDIVGGRNLSFSLALPPFEHIKPGKSPIKDEWKLKDIDNYVHFLDIENKDFKQIWKNNFKKSTRKHIRKAKRSGVETRDASSIDDFKTYYDIYVKATKKWGLGSPEYPFDFSRNLYMYGSSHVKLRLAFKDDKIIAGLLCFHYAKTIYQYSSAFLPEYGNLNPGNLLRSDAINQACIKNYKVYNLGHSGDLKGVRKFKAGFGAEEVEVKRYLAWSKGGRILNQIKNSFLK